MGGLSPAQGACDFDKRPGKLLALQDNQPVGRGEVINFESVVLQIDSQVWRYLYCVDNQRQYRSVKVIWGDSPDIHFSNYVPPQDNRFQFHDTTERQYATPKLTFVVDGQKREPSPETIIQASEVIQPKRSISLQSGGIIDIPATLEVAAAIESDKYEKYDKRDFLRVSFEFSSTADPTSSATTGVISNKLRLVPVDKDLGTEFIKTISAYKKSIFWDEGSKDLLFEREAPIEITAESFGDKPVAQTESKYDGPIIEKKGFISLIDEKNIIRTPIIPITYFVPLSRR
jgi:hypothetical protein